MNKTDKDLTILYILTLLVMSVIAVLFEFIKPEFMGVFFDPDDRTIRTVMEVLSTLGSLAGVYAAMKLLSIRKVADACQQNEAAYKKWAVCRWLMVAGPMMLCLLTYYLFFSTNVAAFLGIGAIALLFVWPTQDRRRREMNLSNEENGTHDA